MELTCCLHRVPSSRMCNWTAIPPYTFWNSLDPSQPEQFSGHITEFVVKSLASLLIHFSQDRINSFALYLKFPLTMTAQLSSFSYCSTLVSRIWRQVRRHASMWQTRMKFVKLQLNRKIFSSSLWENWHFKPFKANSTHWRLTHPVPGWYNYGDLALQVGRVSNLRQYNMVTSFAGLGSKNDCAGEDPAAIANGRPVLSLEKAPHINRR
jgi:hypothetical protein